MSIALSADVRRLAKGLDSVSAGYCLIDRYDCLEYVNDSLIAYFPDIQNQTEAGMQASELIALLTGSDAHQQSATRDHEKGIDGWETLVNTPINLMAYHVLHGQRCLSLKRVSIDDVGSVLIVTDVTSQKYDRHALAQSEQKFKRFARLTSQWFWELDDQLRYRYHSTHNPALAVKDASALVGHSRVETLPSRVKNDDQLQTHNRALKAHEPLDVILTWDHPEEGRIRYSHVQAEPQFDEDGNFSGYIGCGKDVTIARELCSRFQYHATHDHLTGLMNRRSFEVHLTQLIEQQSMTGSERVSEHTLIWIDMDRFKLVNDDAGHAAGDTLLVEIATLLDNAKGARACCARLGGDEFALCVNQSIEQAQRLAEQILDSVRHFQFVWNKKTFSIGASLGVAPIDHTVKSFSGALKNAHVACYSAKMLGRNRVEVFCKNNFFQRRQSTELATLRMIGSALNNDRLQLYLQPISPCRSSTEPQKYEVLVRLIDDSGQLIYPQDFIQTAEKYNVMQRIDLSVVKKAMLCIVDMADNGVDLSLCVNLSGNTLGCEACLEEIAQHVEALSLPKNKLCFEITETAAIKSLDAVNRFINRLRTSACEFSLDDFGSGLSSYSYLESLQVDYIKIDGSFVSRMLTETSSSAIVESINSLSHEMNMKTVAEFVDNQAQAEALSLMGVDYVQGHFLGKPAPIARVMNELQLNIPPGQ